MIDSAKLTVKSEQFQAQARAVRLLIADVYTALGDLEKKADELGRMGRALQLEAEEAQAKLYNHPEDRPGI